MAPAPDAIAPEDDAVLARVAERVVELRMEIPAILTLEGSLPLSVVAGQTMHFFQPVVQALFRLPDYQRFAALVERRDAMTRLIQLIEQRADEAQARRRDASRERRKGKPTRKRP
jgi:hypothetical protein